MQASGAVEAQAISVNNHDVDVAVLENETPQGLARHLSNYQTEIVGFGSNVHRRLSGLVLWEHCYFSGNPDGLDQPYYLSNSKTQAIEIVRSGFGTGHGGR
jgi:hypothetical protein